MSKAPHPIMSPAGPHEDPILAAIREHDAAHDALRAIDTEARPFDREAWERAIERDRVSYEALLATDILTLAGLQEFVGYVVILTEIDTDADVRPLERIHFAIKPFVDKMAAQS